jgi:hypothetical protein
VGSYFRGDGVKSVYSPSYNDFSPRVGFTYSPAAMSTMVIRGAAGLYYDTPAINIFLSQQVKNGGSIGLQGNPAGAAPVFSLPYQGAPHTQYVSGTLLAPLGTTPAATCYYKPATGSTPAVANPCGLFTVDPNLRNSYTTNYSLNIQSQIGHGMIMQLGYVGSQARKLILLRDINQAALNKAGTSTTTLQKQQSRPYFNQFPMYSAINEVESIGNANYKALQASIRMQNVHGFTSMFSYVWSHNFDDGTNYRQALPQDSNNIKADYGNSIYDITNTFSAHMSYAVPYYQKLPHWLGAGWDLNSLMSIYGGEPFSIQSSADRTGTGEGSQRAIQLLQNPYANTNHSLKNGPVRWINAASFGDAPNGTFATSRRTQYRGPGYQDVDFSVFKTGDITEKVRVQFRAEMSISSITSIWRRSRLR